MRQRFFAERRISSPLMEGRISSQAAGSSGEEVAWPMLAFVLGVAVAGREPFVGSLTIFDCAESCRYLSCAS